MNAAFPKIGERRKLELRMCLVKQHFLCHHTLAGLDREEIHAGCKVGVVQTIAVVFDIARDFHLATR